MIYITPNGDARLILYLAIFDWTIGPKHRSAT